MKYGYFDNEKKEYVIERPDTPRSWTNYLGSSRYGSIITNNAGGYSFYRSAAHGRFMRWRPNTIPMDQPGRYIYLRDNESCDYWSASWQPVGKPLSEYKSECRHGTGYTIISSDYKKIKTQTTYFVPLNKNFECWWLKITNTDNKKRNLSLFPFIEFSSHWYLWNDMVNLQYSQHIIRMEVIDNIISQGINVFIPEAPENFRKEPQGRFAFLGLAGAKISGFDTDRDKFIGSYRTYANPIVVERGKCENSLATADNGCGSLQSDIHLLPGESMEVVIIAGVGKADREGKAAVDEFKNIKTVQDEFYHVKNYWHIRLAGMKVETPDTEFNSMMNTWMPYNCLITYSWSRAASLIYAGERDGLGYRDTVQDLLGVMHTIPEEAGKKLELMISGQVSSGGAMPVVEPFAHKPGEENPPKEEEYRSDDCLWLFNTIPTYVKEMGDTGFYKKIIPYADKGEDTIFGHMKQAIRFNLDRMGAHGLPCGLYADWNDCLELGHTGETVFVAFQLRYALTVYSEVAMLLNLQPEAEWAKKHLTELDKNIEKHAWEGDRFIRAIRFDGQKYGSKENKEGSIYLNAQTWAVISGYANNEQKQILLNSMKERLATDYGLMLCDPPYETSDFSLIKAVLYNKGMKENASIFCHTQGWAVIAETLNGNGNQAYDYFRASLPAAYNNKAEIREIEPYVYCQFTHSKYSPRYGASRVPWLSGSAAWACYAATQYILGIRPDYNGIFIDPCVPSDWKNFSIRRIFRNKTLTIQVQNKNGVQKGVREIILNNETLKGNYIPVEKLTEKNQITVIMGK